MWRTAGISYLDTGADLMAAAFPLLAHAALARARAAQPRSTSPRT